ncbi:hypothetical protein ACWCQN_36885 [Streptomyces sp. NPDC001984]
MRGDVGQRGAVELITGELHARYVPISKGNQPLARAAAQALLRVAYRAI